MHSLNFFFSVLKIQYLLRAYLPLADKAPTGDYNEKFPLRMMPMLSLSNAWLGYIYTKLTAFLGF